MATPEPMEWVAPQRITRRVQPSCEKCNLATVPEWGEWCGSCKEQHYARMQAAQLAKRAQS